MDPTVELAVDGFPLDPNDPDIRYHRELSTWLEIERSQRVPVALQFDPPSERPRWLGPALRRFAWVLAHGELIAADRKLDARIAELISLLLNRMSLESQVDDEQAFAELASQAAAIEQSRPGGTFRADTARLLLELTKVGIRPATRQNLHAMLRALSPEDRHARMPEVAWKLFLNFDDSDDGKPCWSAHVRRELRELKPTKQKLWISLLKLAPVRNAPDAKWGQKVKQALDRLGREEWESRVASWLSRFHSLDPVALERPGQTLLRLMIEMRHVAESPMLVRSLAALADARWDSSRSKAFWMEIEPRLTAPRPPQTSAPSDRTGLLKLLRQRNHAAFEQIAEYTKQHGYQLEIVEAVREYHDTLHGSVSDQARRQHVGWWLWLEDAAPIHAEDCWSSIVRADLRGFTGSRKTAWTELIGNMTFAVVTKAPAKWTKAAEAPLAAVGPEDFRNQMRRWLAPMSEDKPLRLTTPGRDVLRCLIWDCGLCRPDPQLDEALAWSGRAKWKNKESRDRMLKIEGPLLEVLSARNPGLAQQLDKPAPRPAPKAPDLQSVMQKAMSQMLRSMPSGDRIEIHPDHIFVRGERDHYRIGMDGVITRRSGRRVRVNMDALPPYITQVVQSSVDALDLAQGMFQPNRMRLFSLATILAHDAQWESAIE